MTSVQIVAGDGNAPGKNLSVWKVSIVSHTAFGIALLPFYSLDILGRHLLNHHSRVYVFCLSVQLSPIFRIASITLLGFLALIHSSALPDPFPRLLSLGSGPLHVATVSLGRGVLRLWLLVTR